MHLLVLGALAQGVLSAETYEEKWCGSTGTYPKMEYKNSRLRILDIAGRGYEVNINRFDGAECSGEECTLYEGTQKEVTLKKSACEQYTDDFDFKPKGNSVFPYYTTLCHVNSTTSYYAKILVDSENFSIRTSDGHEIVNHVYPPVNVTSCDSHSCHLAFPGEPGIVFTPEACDDIEERFGPSFEIGTWHAAHTGKNSGPYCHVSLEYETQSGLVTDGLIGNFGPSGFHLYHYQSFPPQGSARVEEKLLKAFYVPQTKSYVVIDPFSEIKPVALSEAACQRQGPTRFINFFANDPMIIRPEDQSESTIFIKGVHNAYLQDAQGHQEAIDISIKFEPDLVTEQLTGSVYVLGGVFEFEPDQDFYL
jgi:hypothetical protein